MDNGNNQPFRLGDWEVHPSRGVIERDGQSVSVRKRAMDVLVHLANRAPDVVSANELIEALWAPAHVNDDAVTVVVSELRKALGDESKDPRYIDTVQRRGYRIVAPVQGLSVHTTPSEELRVALESSV